MITSALARGAGLAAVLLPLALLAPSTGDPLPPVPAQDFSVLPAEQPIGCPGRARLPVGEDAGEGAFSSGSTEVRHDLHTSGAAGAESAGEGFLSHSDAATEVQRVGTGDIAGLAAVACRDPRPTTWLLGGSTATGSSARLVLTNPTSAATEAEVTVYGPAGPLEDPIRVAVGARSQRSLLLEGGAGGLATLAVRVEAAGAGVTAVLQDSRLDGFIPAGTDWVEPAEGPASRLLVPGVGSADPLVFRPSVLRLLSLDGARVSLEYRVAGEAVEWPGSSLRLEPGEVVDVDIPPAGLGTVVVEADSPVLASAVTTIARPYEEGFEGDAARDLAWTGGQDLAGEQRRMAVGPGYRTTLVVYADEDASFRLLDGATVLVAGSLEAGGTVTAPVVSGTGRPLTMEGDVAWLLRVEDDPGFLSHVTPVDVMVRPVAISLAPGLFVPVPGGLAPGTQEP